jgi:hypothetical protein
MVSGKLFVGVTPWYKVYGVKVLRSRNVVEDFSMALCYSDNPTRFRKFLKTYEQYFLISFKMTANFSSFTEVKKVESIFCILFVRRSASGGTGSYSLPSGLSVSQSNSTNHVSSNPGVAKRTNCSSNCADTGPGI